MVESFSRSLQPCRGRGTGPQHQEDHNIQQRKYREAPCPPGRNNAIKLNHEAVILLMSGSDEEKAMEVLKLGLSQVKSDLASSARSSPSTSRPSSLSKCQDDEHDCKDSKDSKEVIPRRRAANAVPPSRCSCDDDHSHVRILSQPVYQSRQWDDDGFYLYANAFTFDLSNFDESIFPPPSSMIDTEILSATIIYNLALALTTKGIRANSSSVLRRSMRLYEMSMGLLSKIIMLPRTIHSKRRNLSYEFALNVAIACSNNLGQLAYRQGDYDRSETMRGTLQYMLSLPLLDDDDDDESRLQRSRRIVFTETDMRGFKLNIMFMYPPTLAPLA